MNIDLDKTLGYDMGKRAGVEALHKTLSRSTPAAMGDAIAADLTTMLNQAINTMLANPAKPGATLPLAQVTGYLGELARVTGSLAAGKRFACNQVNGESCLVIQPAGSKKISN